MERATSARPDRGHELIDERAAENCDLGLRLVLEGVEREGNPQLRAIAEPLCAPR